jgi:hypothetical protein
MNRVVFAACCILFSVQALATDDANTVSYQRKRFDVVVAETDCLVNADFGNRIHRDYCDMYPNNRICKMDVGDRITIVMRESTAITPIENRRFVMVPTSTNCNMFEATVHNCQKYVLTDDRTKTLCSVLE